MPFVHHTTARFYEVDAAGIVFFGRVYEYCHGAFEELLTAVFGSTEAWLGAEIGMPLVHSEADHERPIRSGTRLAVEVRVARLSPRSVTFAYEVRGADDGVVRARVRLIHAFTDMKTFKGAGRPMPGLVEGLERLGLVGPDGVVGAE
jgi:YbgC/YbaW family acyl-CoA thioester hydrolase